MIGSVAPGSLHLAGHLSELGGVRPPADVMGLVLCEGGGSLSLPPTAPRVLPIPSPHVRRLLLSPPGWARGPVLAISPFTGCCPKTHLESPLFPERWSHPQPTTESLSLASCLLTHKCVCVCVWGDDCSLCCHLRVCTLQGTSSPGPRWSQGTRACAVLWLIAQSSRLAPCVSSPARPHPVPQLAACAS